METIQHSFSGENRELVSPLEDLPPIQRADSGFISDGYSLIGRNVTKKHRACQAQNAASPISDLVTLPLEPGSVPEGLGDPAGSLRHPPSLRRATRESVSLLFCGCTYNLQLVVVPGSKKREYSLLIAC